MHVVPVVPDGFRAVRGRRCKRWRRETHEQPCCEYQCRAPAGFDFHVAISRFRLSLIAKRDPGACPQRGKKRESSGWAGRKLGNGRRVPHARLSPVGEIILESMAPVPAEGIGVMSLLAAMAGRHLR